MTDSLETIVEQSSKPGKMRQFAVDTLATLTWGAAVGLPIKLFAIGMDWKQTLVSMVGDAAVNAAFGGTYGKYLDLLYRKQNLTPESSGARKYWTDYFAFNTFWHPVVAGVLYATGVVTGNHLTPKQYLVNLAVGSTLGLFIAPANRWYMHAVRKLFGVTPKLVTAPAASPYQTPAAS